MSVIMGLKTENIVILAADKRGCGANGTVITEELTKIYIVNNHVAFAGAGNLAISKAIMMDIEKVESRKELYIEDVIKIMRKFYKHLVDVDAKTLLSFPAKFIIGGLNKQGNLELYGCNNKSNGKFEVTEVDMLLFPPEDVSMQEASEIFVKNLHEETEKFMEQTVADIAEKSIWVNSVGDKWIYDNRSKMAELKSF